jgi:hypothetical protein
MVVLQRLATSMGVSRFGIADVRRSIVQSIFHCT